MKQTAGKFQYQIRYHRGFRVGLKPLQHLHVSCSTRKIITLITIIINKHNNLNNSNNSNNYIKCTSLVFAAQDRNYSCALKRLEAHPQVRVAEGFVDADGLCSALGNAMFESATWIESCRTQKVQFRATSPIRLRAGHMKTWPAMHSSTRPRHVYACP